MTAGNGADGRLSGGTRRNHEDARTRARPDGVRALAVLAVIGFHEGASELPGGFLGVDLFFVLSGFLITDLLVARYAETGRWMWRASGSGGPGGCCPRWP